MSTSLDILDEAFRQVGLRSRPIDVRDPRSDLAVRGVSNGLIEISAGPIKWVHWRYSPIHEAGSYFDFAVPDQRLETGDLSSFWIDAIPPSWSSRLRGVRGASWRGDDAGTGMLAGLREARDLNALWRDLSGPEVRVLVNSGAFNIWRISMTSHPQSSGMHVPGGEKPSRWPGEWKCLTTLAQQLLDTPLRHPTM
jgi:hypothetical protein